jgi:UDP-N-acetylmuramoyl-tripeptide--D-alanyl-D-alanine ligase
MDARSLNFIAAACHGELLHGSPQTRVQQVSTDSRQVRSGDLFVALSGERFDGHKFVEDAARKGAAGVVVGRSHSPRSVGDCAVILVDDTRQALGRLATQYRAEFQIPVVAVAGSNGKTTTKELVASVLSQRRSTLYSEASFNNDIGVPLTLLRMEGSHQAAVLEAGTNHPGELAPLVKMIRPDYGVLTCIGREHLEFFGDLEGVAREEGSLAELLPASGKLFLNGDDVWASAIAQRTTARVVRVGLAEHNDWRARGVRLCKDGVTFRVSGPQAAYAGSYKIHLLGRHQVINALFAIAIGAEMGLEAADIARGLASCKPPKMRMQLWEFNGIKVLDDAYNANADSMLAALRTLQELPCKGRRVAVLGDMAELGGHSEAAHEEVGGQAARLGVGQLFAIGRMASALARGARAAGLNRIMEFGDVEAAAAAVRGFLRPGDVVLLKASRATRLERLSEIILGGEAARKN